MSVEQLQHEIRENDALLLREMGEALKRCRTPYEREQCRAAHYRLSRAREDVICQRHGLPGKLWADNY